MTLHICNKYIFVDGYTAFGTISSNLPTTSGYITYNIDLSKHNFLSSGYSISTASGFCYSLESNQYTSSETGNTRILFYPTYIKFYTHMCGIIKNRTMFIMTYPGVISIRD